MMDKIFKNIETEGTLCSSRFNFFLCISITFLLFLAAPLFTVQAFAEAATEEEEFQSMVVFSLLQDYGDETEIQNELQDDLSTASEPLVLEYEDVRITIDELLYDGLWMFAAAKIAPLDPDEVLVIPGSASPNDAVAGIYGENARDDDRSFIDAAKEDGKRLLSVYAYPTAYVGEYAMDYRQLPNDVSAFLSCGEVNSDGNSAVITWSIEIYEIDLDTMRSSELLVTESEPQEVYPIREPLLHEYQLVSNTDAPFVSLTVMESALTTYVLPRWADEEDRYMFSINALDEYGQPLQYGLALDTRSVLLTDIPNTLIIEIDGEYQLVFGLISP